MKQFSILCLCSLVLLTSNAQTTFRKSLPGLTPSSAGCLTKTQDGGTLAMGIGGGSGNYDVVITKFDSLYDVKWSNDFDFGAQETGYSIIQTKDKNIVVAATQFYSTLDSLTTLVVFKLTPTGSLLWSKKIVTSGNVSPASIVETKSKTLLVAATVTPAGTSNGSILLVNLDNNGNLLATKKFTPNLSVNITKMIPDYSGGFLLAGHYYDFETLYGLLIDINSNGNVKWAKYYHSSGYFNSVAKTSDKGYVAAGALDPLTNRGYDFYVAKTDSSGKVQWSRLFGSTNFDEAYDIKGSSDGNIVATGYASVHGRSTPVKSYTIKLDNSGQLLWSRMVNEGIYLADGRSVVEDNDHSYLVLGSNTNPQNSGGYFLKLTSDGTACNSNDTLSGLKTLQETTSTLSFTSSSDGSAANIAATVFPGITVSDICTTPENNIASNKQVSSSSLECKPLINPVADKIVIQLKDSKTEQATITISDYNGIINQVKNIVIPAGTSTIEIASENLVRGIHFIKVTTTQSTRLLKIIKQ